MNYLMAIALVLFLMASSCNSHSDKRSSSSPVIDGDLSKVEFNYWQHAKIILDRACSPCHMIPASGGASEDFILNQYEDYNGVSGVFSKLSRIQARVVDGTMPPVGSGYELSADELTTLVEWLDQGGIEGQRPTDILKSPKASFVLPANDLTANTSILLEMKFEDLVSDASWSLYYTDQKGSTQGGSLITERPATETAYVWDTSSIPVGVYYVYAVLSNSDKKLNIVNPYALTIAHPEAGNSIPTVQVTSPNGGESIFVDSDLLVTYSIHDDDPGDETLMKFDIAVSSDNGLTWESLASDHSSQSYTWSIPADQTLGQQYLLRVRADDGKGGVAFDQSDSVFEVRAPAIAIPSFDDFNNIARNSCGGNACHGDAVGQKQYVDHQANILANKDSLILEISTGGMPKNSSLSSADKETMLNYLNSL